MSACRGCGAPIHWAVTAAGKAIPLDAEPNPDGNMALTGATVVASSTGKSGPAVIVVGPPGMLDDGHVRYMPHHATCAKVEEFRT